MPFKSIINIYHILFLSDHGVTKRYIVYLGRPIAPSYMSPNAGGGVVSANEYSCAHGAEINFGDLTTYLTNDS